MVLQSGQVWTCVTLVREARGAPWPIQAQLGLEIRVTFSIGRCTEIRSVMSREGRIDTRVVLTRSGRTETRVELTRSGDFIGEYMILWYSGSACYALVFGVLGLEEFLKFLNFSFIFTLENHV